MNRQRFLLPALTVLTLMRLAMLPLRELSPLEAYGYLCSQRPDAWHAMLGPVLPSLVRVTTGLFGATELGVRVASPLLILLATILLWKLARGLFDANTASWSVVIFSALPEVNLAAVTMTPTTLGITGSVALLYLLRRALHRSHHWHLPWWSVAITFLLMLCVSWQLLMLPVAAAASLAVTRRGRSAVLKWPVLPVLLGTLALGFIVGIVWASEHHWMPLTTEVPEDVPFAGQLWAVALAHSPILIAALGWGLFHSITRKPLTYPVACLYAFASPMLTLDALTCFSSSWPMSGYGGWLAPACILLAHQMTLWSPQRMQMKAWLRTGAVAVGVIQSCIVMNSDLVRTCGIAWKLSPRETAKVSVLPADPCRNLVGWKSIASELQGVLEEVSTETGQLPCVVTDRWQTAAALSFYVRGGLAAQPTSRHPAVHFFTTDSAPNPFSLWPDLSEWEGPIVFITDESGSTGAPKALTETRPQQRPSGWFDVTHQGLLVRTIKVFTCSAEIAGEK